MPDKYQNYNNLTTITFKKDKKENAKGINYQAMAIIVTERFEN